SNPAFSVLYSGFRNGDTESTVSGLAIATTANQTSPAGAYAIVPGNATAANYSIAYVNGTLVITGAALPDSVLHLIQTPVSVPPLPLSQNVSTTHVVQQPQPLDSETEAFSMSTSNTNDDIVFSIPQKKEDLKLIPPKNLQGLIELDPSLAASH